MQVQPVPAPATGPTPKAVSDAGAASLPQPGLTPNPYGIPDQVVQNRAGSAADRFSADMHAALQNLYNTAIGDDLHIANDPSQSGGNRLLHAGIAGATLLSLVGGPESLGLKLATKETLKGGIEQITYHAIAGVAERTGKLVLQSGVRLSSDELKVAAELTGRGHEVIARPASGVGKTADFLIDGKPTELKTISKVNRSVGTAVTETIEEATKQSKNVIIDARNQRGLTEADALASMRRAIDGLPKSRINEVRLLGRNGNQPFELLVKK